MTNVGEIEHHRHADELVAPLVEGGSASSDDDFRKVVAKGHADVIEGHRCLTVNDECGQSRKVQQPSLLWHEIVAVARAKAYIGHLQFHSPLAVKLSLLPLPRYGQEKTASAATLDIALRKDGRIGESAAIQHIEGFRFSVFTCSPSGSVMRSLPSWSCQPIKFLASW